MKIIEDLGQILVVLHTLLVIIEMTPRLNKQSGSDQRRSDESSQLSREFSHHKQQCGVNIRDVFIIQLH